MYLQAILHHVNASRRMNTHRAGKKTGVKGRSEAAISSAGLGDRRPDCGALQARLAIAQKKRDTAFGFGCSAFAPLRHQTSQVHAVRPHTAS